MSKPARNADPDHRTHSARTFFVTTKTAHGKRLFQLERNARLFIDVLRAYASEKKFQVHDFVVMPDHVHILLTVHDLSIERAVQLIKGGFSIRLKKAGYAHDVWHRGFADQRVFDRSAFLAYSDYIAQNPVKAGLASHPDSYPFCFRFLARQRSAVAKASIQTGVTGTTEVVPLHEPQVAKELLVSEVDQ